MTINYETYTSENSGVEFIIAYNEDGSITCIPKDPANSDYQRYLNSEAEAPNV
jgi:hypothetical protein